MKSPSVSFEHGVIEDAFGQIEALDVWPKDFSIKEIKAARKDLERRVLRLVEGLCEGDKKAYALVQVYEERPRALLIPTDKAGLLQAVALLLKVEDRLIVIKIWVRSAYLGKRGVRHENRHDPSTRYRRGKTGL